MRNTYKLTGHCIPRKSWSAKKLTPENVNPLSRLAIRNHIFVMSQLANHYNLCDARGKNIMYVDDGN